MARTYDCITCHATRPSKGWKQLGWEIHNVIDEEVPSEIKAPKYRFDVCAECAEVEHLEAVFAEIMDYERQEIVHKLYANPDDCDCLICHPNQ